MHRDSKQWEEYKEEKIRDANEKRRAFYKTATGIAVKKAYNKKAAKKRQIINKLSELELTSLADPRSLKPPLTLRMLYS